MIDAKLKDIIVALGVKYGRSYYKSNNKPNTYLVYGFIAAIPDDYADDNATTTKHTCYVNIYSKSDYTALLDNLITALKNNDFIIDSVDTEIFEEDTGYYHRPITISYLEV